MKINTIIKQGLTFVFGLFIMAFGVSLSVKADLGVSPVSCVPYVYSLKFPLTIGQTTIIMNIMLILFQVLLLRKKYQLFQLIQFPVVFLFGYFIDLTLNLISGLESSDYLWQMVYCLFGLIILAIGVFFEVKSKITFLPGEGLAMAINQTFKVEFGKAKIGVDSSMVIIGIISSFVFLYSLKGIREGTIVAAFLVGYIVKFLNKKIFFLDKFIFGKDTEEAAIPKEVKKEIETEERLVITISREYGSGGHEIGKAVARQLGLTFYDKELIKLTSEDSGFTQEYINEHEQKLSHSLLYQLYEQNYNYINERKPPLNALFLVQSKIIRDIYKKESCVIIGRCANFILKDKPGCLNIFIHADDEYRKRQISIENKIEKEVADEEIEKTDRERANYCKKFTGQTWGDVKNYNLSINSSAIGIPNSVQLIVDAVNIYMRKD